MTAPVLIPDLGEIAKVTLFKTPSGEWQASASKDGVGWSVAIAAAPAEALALLLPSDLAKDVDIFG